MSETIPSSVRIFAAAAEGNDAAATELFGRYVQRLSRFARARLAPRLARRVDAEDVVMSAYRSFFVAAREGRFSIDEAGDLWALLTTITLRKVLRQAAYHGAAKRDIHAEAYDDNEICLADWMVSNEPGPGEAAQLVDEVEHVLTGLAPAHRRIVELRLQGASMTDIAGETATSERTVRRVLSALRENLCQQYGVSDDDIARTTKCSAEQRVATVGASTSPNPNCTVKYSDLLLEQLIGRGGMGKVYRAIDQRTQQQVAVKFLHRSFQANTAVVRKFLDEATTVEDLNHPAIAAMRGMGRTPAGVYFIVMELVDGRDLTHMSLPVDAGTAIDWCISLAGGLGIAHARGIIHCDLKPANVLIRKNGNPVIVDFGLAHVLRDDERAVRAVAGTAPWMAPEQIEPQRGRITAQTDVYGLGALLYTLLTGRPPFHGRQMTDVMALVVSATTPRLPSDIVKDLDPRIDAICLKCLAKNPSERPPSIGELATELRQFAAAQGSHTD